MNLKEYIITFPDAKKRFEFNIEIKSKVRHKIINIFDDFSDKDKEYLIELKQEVFKGNDIYIFGSRINGTYLTDDEYKKYSKIYNNVKKSDWDIRSNFRINIREFKGYKIDSQIGNKGIKV
jgi:hypothetical protein